MSTYSDKITLLPTPNYNKSYTVLVNNGTMPAITPGPFVWESQSKYLPELKSQLSVIVHRTERNALRTISYRLGRSFHVLLCPAQKTCTGEEWSGKTYNDGCRMTVNTSLGIRGISSHYSDKFIPHICKSPASSAVQDFQRKNLIHLRNTVASFGLLP